MIRLGTIEVTQGTRIAAVRSRIHGACLALTLPAVMASRVATACAELARALTDLPGPAGLDVGLVTTESHEDLVIELFADAPVPVPDHLAHFFTTLGPVQGSDGRRVRGVVELRRGVFHDTRHLAQARSHLHQRSRTELVADLRQKNDALGQQQRRLERAMRDAQRANQAKSRFLANMSHELRTPMNSILGFTRRLMKGLDGKVSERDLDALATIDRNARHLLALINDILDLSKIEAGRMELTTSSLDLRALVDEVMTQCRPLLKADVQQLRVVAPGEPVTVRADHTKLRQVLTNLVSNAIKYSDAGTISIGLSWTEDEEMGRVAAVSVTDEGAGMTAEQQRQLFSRFTRLDNEATRKVGGTGLGLTISNHYMGMHGGALRVRSQVGEGSTFTMLVPPEPRAVRPLNGPALAGGDGPVILCVDDDPDLLSFVQLTFEDANMRVMVAQSFSEALPLAREHKPDLICLDVNLPDRTGFDVIAALREDPATAEIPVVLLSGEDHAARAQAEGARTFLRKPVDPSELLRALSAALRGDLQRVLIVDDADDTRSLLVQTFVHLEVPVDQAADGREAMALMRRAPPSVVILDLMMPVMGGIEVLEAMRADPVLAQVPVVVYSGVDLQPAQLEKLRQLSAAVLPKGDTRPYPALGAVLGAWRDAKRETP